MRAERPHPDDDRSLGELFSELTEELTTLVRQEAQLARTELTEKARDLGRNAGFIGAGGAVAYAGFLALVAALIVGLGQLGVTWWLAALIVGVVVAAIGYMLIQRGVSGFRRAELAPRRTTESLKEDREMVKEKLR
jgi:hypothetical protein